MRVVFRVKGNPWWLRQIHHMRPEVQLTRAEKLRLLLNSAMATPHFSRRDRTETLLAVNQLDDLPVISKRDVLQDLARFVNPGKRRAQESLQLPFAARQCVLIGKELRLPAGVMLLEEAQMGKLHLGLTSMIAATPATLRRLCAAVEARTLAFPHLTEAVVVLQGMEEGFLYEGERDMLWRCLGVPVFEQWLGLGGELLAFECVSHQGMHFNEERAELEEVNGELVVTSWYGLRYPIPRLATGLSAQIGTSVCQCGSTKPILREIGAKKRAVEIARAMAIA